MLDELKNAYKLVQYGLKIKMQLGMAVLFVVLGIGIEILAQGQVVTGSFYIVLSGMFIYQLIISVDNSTLVQSSPYKKKIQCTYPLIATAPWVYMTLTIISVIHGIFAQESAEMYSTMCRMTLLLGALLFILMIYFGLAYKYFIIGTVVMFVSVFPPIIILQNDNPLTALFTSYPACVVISYVLTTLGVIGCWIIAKVTYKRDLDKWAFKAAMKTK